jgi:hypothetical protein
MRKICKKCNIEKNLSDFDRNKGMLDGYINTCKVCVSLYCKDRYINKKDDIIKKVKKYSIENQEKIRKSSKKYRILNKEEIKRKQNLKYSQTRKSKRVLKTKEEKREYYRLWQINRKKIDVTFKLYKNIRNLIRNGLLSKNHKKTSKTKDILGCKIEDFRFFIESKFEPWMNWNNHGKYNGQRNYGWDLDHIVPISSSTNVNDIVKLNHYTNFQPLCSKLNRHIKRGNFNKFYNNGWF